jgi:hypothetical protein
VESPEIARRLHGVAMAVEHISAVIASGQDVDPDTLDRAVAQLKGPRVHAYGRSRAAGAAIERIRRYLLENASEITPGEEIAEVAGISEWARRLRELRAEGLQISQPASGCTDSSSCPTDARLPIGVGGPQVVEVVERELLAELRYVVLDVDQQAPVRPSVLLSA